MVERSNEISREICRVRDANDEPSTFAAGDTASPMAQVLGRYIARLPGNELAISATKKEAARQKSELS
jgi:hypothetical protein